jgi:hypothetical protein
MIAASRNECSTGQKFVHMSALAKTPSVAIRDPRARARKARQMEPAIKGIVDTYVRLGKRREIEDLLMHRQRLVIDLKARRGYDYSRPIAQIDQEIEIIEAALQKLEPPDQSMATRRLRFA